MRLKQYFSSPAEFVQFKNRIKTVPCPYCDQSGWRMGYSLRKLEYDNYLVENHGSVIVRDNYWFCKPR